MCCFVRLGYIHISGNVRQGQVRCSRVRQGFTFIREDLKMEETYKESVSFTQREAEYLDDEVFIDAWEA